MNQLIHVDLLQKKKKKTESELDLSPLFIIQEVDVRLCKRSDNTENTKESILISQSDGVNRRLWDHMHL